MLSRGFFFLFLFFTTNKETQVFKILHQKFIVFKVSTRLDNLLDVSIKKKKFKIKNRLILFISLKMILVLKKKINVMNTFIRNNKNIKLNIK